jgi:DNA-binding response OmpR family regulator
VHLERPQTLPLLIRGSFAKSSALEIRKRNSCKATSGGKEDFLQEQKVGTSDAIHPAAKLLVAEDDAPLAHFLKRGLQSNRYEVDVVHDGEMALQSLRSTPYDLLILDLNLPKLDGLKVLGQLRPVMPNLPVLVLTGKVALEDRVLALDTGADDCLIKPFSFHELGARTRALLRRKNNGCGRVLQVGDLILDREQFKVERSGKRVDLTNKEFSLLEYLMMNAKKPVTRAMIMENVWKAPYDSTSNLVDVYVKYVRDKVDPPESSPKLLRTIRGVGYVIADN